MRDLNPMLSPPLDHRSHPGGFCHAPAYERAPSCYIDLVSDAIMQVFRETGAYLNGHFRLTSGLHSNEYLQCALVLARPAIAERLGRRIGRFV